MAMDAEDSTADGAGTVCLVLIRWVPSPRWTSTHEHPHLICWLVRHDQVRTRLPHLTGPRVHYRGKQRRRNTVY